MQDFFLTALGLLFINIEVGYERHHPLRQPIWQHIPVCAKVVRTNRHSRSQLQRRTALSDKKIIVYLGGLYAGGILGLMKTLRGFSLRDGQKLLIVTVGLADPNEPENQNNIRASLQRQLPARLLDRAKVFHLRGGIDYQKLSFGHRTMMKLLYQSLRRTPLEKQTTEDRALIETYGKQVDFTDFGVLEPIIWEIQRETK